MNELDRRRISYIQRLNRFVNGYADRLQEELDQMPEGERFSPERIAWNRKFMKISEVRSLSIPLLYR